MAALSGGALDRLRRLRLANTLRDRIAATEDHEGAVSDMTPRRLRRRLYEVGLQAMGDRLTLAAGVADVAALRPLLATIAAWKPPRFPVSGEQIKAAGAAEGPEVGRVRRAVETGGWRTTSRRSRRRPRGHGSGDPRALGRPMTSAPGPLWRPYTQMKTAASPLEAVSTDGARIRLADGRELVDGLASWWTACHGYNHPHIRAAVADQLARMPHVMFGGLTHAPAERLAARLAALLPGELDHVFFTDSGSVAVEVALKMALQLWKNRGVDGRTRFLAFHGGYHGDTLGAMSVCDPEDSLHARFGEGLPAAGVRRSSGNGRTDRRLGSHAFRSCRQAGRGRRRAAGAGGRWDALPHARHAGADRRGGAAPRAAADRR